jgi:hypothetical protein
VANSQSQDLNLQRGDRALHSSLQEWITQQSKCETTDQGNGKALPDLDDDTSRIRQSYFSPSVVSPESVVYPDHAPSGTSPEPSIAPQRANIREAGSRASVERRAAAASSSNSSDSLVPPIRPALRFRSYIEADQKLARHSTERPLRVHLHRQSTAPGSISSRASSPSLPARSCVTSGWHPNRSSGSAS